jgi:2,7-dihydroxy-5-methyl-1-naphthoate 7-O-methyltransferase
VSVPALEATPTSLRLMSSLVTPMALRVAATLRLVDQVADGVTTAAELAGRTGTDPGALGRVLDHLVTLQVLTTDGAGGYAVTAHGDQLRDDHPDGLRKDLDINGGIGRAELAHVEMLDAVRTGDVVYPKRYGVGFWEDLAGQPELQRSFDAKMTRRYALVAGQVAERYPWSRHAHVMDVGGGNGTLMREVLARHPGVRATVLDQAPTAQDARETFAAAGLAERGTAVVGSFFEPLPTGADAYVLSDILHDWEDASAAAILGRCAEAAGDSGVVLVVESLRGDYGDRPPNTALDLMMLSVFGGRERRIDELGAMAAGCGLELRAVHDAADERTLLEFGRAGT